MLYQLYNLIYYLLKYDSYYHVIRRAYEFTKLTGHIGVAMIEYGRQQSEVIWQRNTPKDYLEEVVKINPNHFTSKNSLL